MSGSRLIIKNLPSTITSDKLRNSFSSKGQVTDVQLKYTKDGKFRHFGFVGFKNENEAEAARNYFNNTFMGATKISVEVCADLGDASKPRAWSKYAPDSSAYQNSQKKTDEDEGAKDVKEKSKKELKKEKQAEVDQLLVKHKDDPKFQEFMRIHKRNAAGSWNNDAILEMGRSYAENPPQEEQPSDENEPDEESESSEEGEGDENEEKKVAFDNKVSDMDYLKSLSGKTNNEAQEQEQKPPKEPKNEDYFTVKLTGLPYKAKKKDVKKFLKPLKPKSIRVPPKIKGIAYAGFATEKEWKNALNKSKGFIGSSQIFVIRYDKQRNDAVTKQREEAWKKQEDSLKNEETIAESGRLFVRNLPYSVTEEEIESLFKPFGPLTEVNLPIDKNTRKVKGFAFVTYVIPENAVQAYSKLDGTTFQGRLLHLIAGKAKLSEEELAEGVLDKNSSSYKREKAAKEKAKAQSSHNWNTLFLGASAVADLMADRYGVEKKDVLDDQGQQSAAVRLALGETQIVAETRTFLEEQGVSLDAFGKPPTKRSKTVLIIKNLPAGTSPEEIRDKFAPFGELGRVILPPKGITAIVEFYEPTEARASFKKLAYTKFKGTPLYLEWAPEETFTTKLEPKKPVKEEENGKTSDEATEAATEEPAEDDATLFVKNLSFETTDDELRTHFASVGRVFSATVATKKNPKQVGGTLSMGYGFVQFFRKADASSALKTLQHKQLNGHCLELKRSNRAAVADSFNAKQISKAKPTTKIVVRNVPFEATQREIEDIFKTFGQLKAVRLPKKVTGNHRGFAFVDFHTIEEAKKSFEALCHSTHLYGRRLVLEWAESEETVDDLRKKTANSFSSGGPPSKRVKKSDIAESLAMSAPSKDY